MLQISKRNATLASLMLAMGLSMTACSKHESAEHKPTEEVAAQQGEIARANHPAPAASEPAAFTTPAATASANTATATASSTTITTTTTTTETTTVAAGSAATATKVSAGGAGEALYTSTCKTCHEAGIAGAPKVGDKAAWKDRIAQGKDTLHKHAIAGFQGKAGMMPAKGGSQASDDDVKAAVDYMVSKSS